MKPIIGITVDVKPDPANARTEGKLELNYNYAQAIADAGGTPLLIPPQAAPEDVLSLLDGLLIPGGDDIDARNWGEPNHGESKLIAEERFNAERKLFKALDPGLPVLGICYGCQFINVMRGGTLNQHLPDNPEADLHADGKMQRYEIQEDSKLAGVAGGLSISGESWHHQAVALIGKGLQAVAMHEEDGTVEAVEATDRPWLIGVQWHPERTAREERTKRLFEAFVQAAAKYREQRATVGTW